MKKLQAEEGKIMKIINSELASLDESTPNLKVVTFDRSKKDIKKFLIEGVYASCVTYLGLFERINQVNVFQQYGGMLCGFHCYWNLQCLVKALIATTQYDVALHLLNLTSPVHFFREYNRSTQLILDCCNSFYVNEADKKVLRPKMMPMERNMLRYLLLHDPQIKALKNNKKDIPVFIRPFLIGFGLM